MTNQNTLVKTATARTRQRFKELLKKAANRFEILCCNIDWRLLCLFESVVYEFKCPHCALFCGIPFIKKEYRDEAGLFSRKAECPYCKKVFQLGSKTIEEVLFCIKKKDFPHPRLFQITYQKEEQLNGQNCAPYREVRYGN